MNVRTVSEHLRARWTQRLALGWIAITAVVAVGADCLASDLPVLLHFRGTTYLLPNLRRPGALRRFDNHTLRHAIGPGDWMLEPLVPYGPRETQPAGRLDVLARPGARHWLGTDDVGRDVLAQLIHGTRTAFLVGVLGVLLYVLVGGILGALAGFLRGPADGLVSWAVAVMTTFPTFLLVLVVQGLAGAQSLLGLVLVLGATGWAGVARLVRGEVMREAARPHVLAARATGASGLRVLLRHVLPAARGPVLVAGVYGVAGAILLESGLAFLGMGVDGASWGRLLAQAGSPQAGWWLAVFPGLAISAMVLAYHFVAEGLAQSLDVGGAAVGPLHEERVSGGEGTAAGQRTSAG